MGMAKQHLRDQRPTGSSASSPKPPVSVPGIVVGKVVDEASNMPLMSPCSSALTFNMDPKAVRSRFELAIYVDEIPPTTPCFVVWQFRRMAKVKLSEREPFFTAKRGYYGEVSDDLVDVIQNEVYHESNSVQYKTVVRTAIPSDRNTMLVRISYRMRNERRGMPTAAVYIMDVDTRCSRSYDTVTLSRISIRLEHQSIPIAIRELRRAPNQHPKSLPNLMLTPQLFSYVSSPARGRYALPISKRLNANVWAALSQQTQHDWNRYYALHCMFDRDYKRRLSPTN